MRIPRTLFRYVAGEITAYSALGFVVFVGVLIAQNLVRRLEQLAAVGFEGQDVLVLAGWLLPTLAAYAVPVAFLFGVLVAVARLSSDSEVTAMRACGLGIEALLAPALAIALAITAATSVLMLEVEPVARVRLRTLVKEIASRGEILQPGRFHAISGRVLYVDDRSEDDVLSRVWVADRSDPRRPFVVAAEQGRLAFDAETAEIVLELDHGDVHLEPAAGDELRHRRIAFEHFRYAFDASALVDSAEQRRPREMRLGELRETLSQIESGTPPTDVREQQPQPYRIQIHRRLALPFAPLVFALLAVPLGIRPGRGARSWGVLLCVALVVGYYALLSLAQFLAETGSLPAAIAFWLPNAVFAAAAVPLLRRAHRGVA